MDNREKGNRRKQYPAYKDSKASWIGNVPIHWNILPNRAIFSEINEREYPGEEMLSVTIGQGVIRQATLLEDDSQKDGSRTDKSAYKLVQPGDIAYDKMRAWQGAIGVSNYRGIISPAYVVERPKGIVDPKYLHYILRTPSFAKEAERWSYGITSDMWSLRAEHFKIISCCVPPLDEQAAIVRYLDEAEQQIQAYITNKEKLIALLEEQRQAIIHQAVTRGLDPNVKLKPSGVEWLGDVPEHWEVKRAKFLFKEIDDRSKEGKETHLSMSQTFGLVPSDQVEQSLISDSYAGAKLCEKGDIVLNRLKAHLGVFALAQQPGVVSADYSIFRQRDTMQMEYFEKILRSPAIRKELRIRSKGIVEGFWRLYTDDFFDIPLPAPSVQEQNEINILLNLKTLQANIEIERTRKQIDLIKEYRTRLITDVVTGNLDVRTSNVEIAK